MRSFGAVLTATSFLGLSGCGAHGGAARVPTPVGSFATATARGPSGAPIPSPRPLAPPPPAEEVVEVRLAATGDVMMHEAVKAAASSQDRRNTTGQSLNHRGFDELFATVAPAVRSTDLAFANLEFPVAPRAGRGTRPFVFNAPPEILAALRAAGFGLVSFANNHAYDQGPAGMVETLDELRKAGLPEVGAGRDLSAATRPVMFTLHGIRIAFLGFTAHFNLDLNDPSPLAPHVNPAEPEEMAREIALAKTTSDLVVVSIHWGTEYATDPDPGQMALAHRLVDAGADIILGSHPHVLERLEVVHRPGGRVALIAYSLGNFISNQSRTYVQGESPPAQADTRDGVLLLITLERRTRGSGKSSVALRRVDYLPLWTENNDLARQHMPELPPRIDVIAIEPALTAARLALTTAVPGSQLARSLQQRISLLAEQKQRIVHRLGPAFAPSDVTFSAQSAGDHPKD